jgi:sulfur carrier protein ThiS
MKKIKKIKIRINGKLSAINDNLSLLSYLKELKIPLKKVAI